MTLSKRLKNLWLLSAYRPLGVGEQNKGGDIIATIKKEYETPKKKLAIIIKEDIRNVLEQEIDQNGEII